MHRYSNQISTTVPDADIKDILGAISLIESKLSKLVILSEEEKASLPRGKSNTVMFVQQCLDYAKQYPKYLPKDIDVKEIRKDMQLIQSISRVMEPLKMVVKKLEDSALLAGSEAYLPCMAIHNAVKSAQASRTGTKKDLHTA